MSTEARCQSYIDNLVFPLFNLIRRRQDGMLQPTAPTTTTNEVVSAVKMDDGCGDFCAGTHDCLYINRPAILLEPASVIAAISHAIWWKQTRTRRRHFFFLLEPVFCFVGTSIFVCYNKIRGSSPCQCLILLEVAIFFLLQSNHTSSPCLLVFAPSNVLFCWK